MRARLSIRSLRGPCSEAGTCLIAPPCPTCIRVDKKQFTSHGQHLSDVPDQLTPVRPRDAYAQKSNRKDPHPGPPEEKEVMIHNVSVQATRKPSMEYRESEASPKRSAERRSAGLLFQEPPRTTRSLHATDSHALPSVRAPS